jgi:hypothetical protein
VIEGIPDHQDVVTEKPIAAIPVHSIGKGKRTIRKISSNIIKQSCEGSYTVYTSLGHKAGATVITFKAHPSEQIALWIMGFIGILIGGGIGFVATWFLNCE